MKPLPAEQHMEDLLQKRNGERAVNKLSITGCNAL